MNEQLKHIRRFYALCPDGVSRQGAEPAVIFGLSGEVLDVELEPAWTDMGPAFASQPLLVRDYGDRMIIQGVIAASEGVASNSLFGKLPQEFTDRLTEGQNVGTTCNAVYTSQDYQTGKGGGAATFTLTTEGLVFGGKPQNLGYKIDPLDPTDRLTLLLAQTIMY